ncbi:MAG TPA: hypothetical protein VN673_03670, partial [Clostridia bacterium]|nr:hypothetical protein [Clostridia bacterium]
MNLTATWAGGSRGSARGGLSVLSRHAAAISAVVVLATVALSLWMCWESRYSLQAQAFVGETEQARANTQA